MASGPIADRAKSVSEILSVIRKLSPAATQAAVEFFTPDVREGESPPDFESVQTFVGRALERRLEDLIRADKKWRAQRTEEQRVRRERAKPLARLRRIMKTIRDGGRFFYEERTGRADIFHGDLPRDADDLVALARKILVWIDNPGVVDHELFSVKKKRQQLERDRAEVVAATQRLTDAEVDTLGARLERKQVLDEFNRDFVHLAGILENLYGLLGYDRWQIVVKASRQEKGLLVSVMKRRRAARAGGAKRSADGAPSNDSSRD